MLLGAGNNSENSQQEEKLQMTQTNPKACIKTYPQRFEDTLSVDRPHFIIPVKHFQEV